MKDNTIKLIEFLEPDRKKLIIFFILIFVGTYIGIVSNWMSFEYFIFHPFRRISYWQTFYTEPVPSILKNLNLGYLIPLLLPTILSIGKVLDLLYYYFLSCLIIWIIHGKLKVKKHEMERVFQAKF